MLGETIKELRREKQLTLQNLSDLTGLSVAFLSQLENDQANPTLASLRKVAAALGTSMFALLAQAENGAACIKIDRDQPRAFSDPRFNVVFELLSTAYHSNKLQALLTNMEPGTSTCDERLGHGTWNDEEWALVLEGEVRLEVGKEEHILKAGDCVHFHPVLPHRYSNVGSTRASLVAVMCPPTY